MIVAGFAISQLARVPRWGLFAAIAITAIVTTELYFRTDRALGTFAGDVRNPYFLEQTPRGFTKLTDKLDRIFVRTPRYQQIADDLARQGRKGYPIPTGGSNALGGLGYVACAQELQQQPEWQDFRETMVICRDFHRRNTLLMNRKLEAIRGTLDSLRLPDTASPVEVYDRLGSISRFSRNNGYSDA